MKIKHIWSLSFGMLLAWSCFCWRIRPVLINAFAIVDQQIAAHPNQSGIYVLEKGEEALIARAWLADHAQTSIEVQYFIWSTDNIGILASEALLRAADRGVKVRVIVDDLLVDAPR
jgi:cardiolipin synthase C